MKKKKRWWVKYVTSQRPSILELNENWQIQAELVFVNKSFSDQIKKKAMRNVKKNKKLGSQISVNMLVFGFQ